MYSRAFDNDMTYFDREREGFRQEAEEAAAQSEAVSAKPAGGMRGLLKGIKTEDLLLIAIAVLLLLDGDPDNDILLIALAFLFFF